jgi:hypothetical protein
VTCFGLFVINLFASSGQFCVLTGAERNVGDVVGWLGPYTWQRYVFRLVLSVFFAVLIESVPLVTVEQ